MTPHHRHYLPQAILCVFFLISAASAEPAELIKRQFDERVELNKQYKEDYTNAVSEHRFAASLKPLAQQNGDDWVALLSHLRDKGEPEVQVLMLRVEHLAEVIPYMLERESAEGKEETQRVSKLLRKFEQGLESLERYIRDEKISTDSPPKFKERQHFALPRKLLKESELKYR